ncbi:PREDICTED: uncharacterized protein LOC109342332 [Lupinus angustifolius]|uniref:uncharacterized protein LOC109342332 n=1 Tax=Lupinus angustifolius TaxID=3871 RepID=UPI00092E4B0F|nr:PREDICTED: uncharacterized protein LOC109342332 [Lupinus angustifolius]
MSQLKNLPYPKNPSKKDKERQYTRFIDIFKNLHINIPFMEAMEQMPTYVKFMKDLLTRKRKFSKETVALEAGCSAIIQKSLPENTKDSGSFTIPVTFGELSVRKALLYLGASINLMPLPMLKRIGDLEIKPTRINMQLADRSMKFLYGVVEDVLVKVDKLVFPVDFMIMDIEEDVEVPLILGRPIMKTARVIIDVDEGKLKVMGQEDEVNFNVFEAMHPPKDKQHCFRVDVGEELYMNDTHLHKISLLEKALMGAPEGINAEDDNSIENCVAELDVYREVSSQQVQIEELTKTQEIENQNLDLKMLPSHLKYTFMEDGGNKLVVISNTLSPGEEQRFIEVLKTNDGATELQDPASQRSWIINGQIVKPYLGGDVEQLTTIIHVENT